MTQRCRIDSERLAESGGITTPHHADLRLEEHVDDFSIEVESLGDDRGSVARGSDPAFEPPADRLDRHQQFRFRIDRLHVGGESLDEVPAPT